MFGNVVVEGADGVRVACLLLMPVEDREVAWDGAREHIRVRPDFGWVMGRFLATEVPNENGHIFGLEEIKERHSLVPHTPLNMLHRPHHILGTFVASELLYPEAVSTPAAASAPEWTVSPWVEALAAFWKYVMPDEYKTVRAAHDQGMAWLSMEAVPKSITCREEDGCGLEFAYEGPQSPSYCVHLNRPRSRKLLNEPHFVGGAIVIPPSRPGWRRADISQVAGLIEADTAEAERVYAEVAAATPVLDGDVWELMMACLLADANGDMPMPERRRNYRMGGQPEDPAVPGGDTPRISKVDAAYRTATDPTSSCGTCMHNQGDGTCMIVAGPIADGDTCDYWMADLGGSLDGPARADDTGVIVAAVPPGDIADTLAALGTEAADQMHVTLAFLGDIEDAAKDRVVEALTAFCATAPAVPTATVSGLGRFALDDGTEATYASVDAPGLNELRDGLVAALEDAGVAVSRRHGFTAHVTLAYHDPGVGPTVMPPTVSFPIDHLELWWGGERDRFPLASPVPA